MAYQNIPVLLLNAADNSIIAETTTDNSGVYRFEVGATTLDGVANVLIVAANDTDADDTIDLVTDDVGGFYDPSETESPASVAVSAEPSVSSGLDFSVDASFE